MINWWKVDLPIEEFRTHVNSVFSSRSFSTGSFCHSLETWLANELGFKHVILTTSGSTALLMASMAADVNSLSNVLIPNRTWIATAHAPHLLGANIQLIDTLLTHPIINVGQILGIQPSVIYPVSLNGCYAFSQEIKSISPSSIIIEDCAQSFMSYKGSIHHGYYADMSCFSLGMSKFLPIGQGGFIATNSDMFADKLFAIRTHGVDSVEDRSPFCMAGMNFKPSDVLASLALAQKPYLSERRNNFLKLYKKYRDYLSDLEYITLLPVDIEAGELPLYIEVIVDDPIKLKNHLKSFDIYVRNVYPDLDSAKYLRLSSSSDLRQSRRFSNSCIVLPSGPDQAEADIDFVLMCLKAYNP